MKEQKYIIADNVRSYRKKQGITQMELAERADLSVDSIKRIESGNRGMSLDSFLRICNALRVPLSFLLYEQNDDVPYEEWVRCILETQSDNQKKYLLHMLQEMADGMEGLLESKKG